MGLHSYLRTRLSGYSAASMHLEYLFKKSLKLFKNKKLVDRYGISYIDSDDKYSISITHPNGKYVTTYHASKKSNDVWSVFVDKSTNISEIDKPKDPLKWKEFLDQDLDPDSKAFSDKFDNLFYEVTER